LRFSCFYLSTSKNSWILFFRFGFKFGFEGGEENFDEGIFGELLDGFKCACFDGGG